MYTPMRRTHGEPGNAAATRVVSRFRDSPFSVFLVLCLSSRFVSFPFVPGRHRETYVNVTRQPAAFLRPARCDAAANVLRRARVFTVIHLGEPIASSRGRRGSPTFAKYRTQPAVSSRDASRRRAIYAAFCQSPD